MSPDRDAPIVQFAQVSKMFGSHHVLRNVGFSLMPGTLAGLVGVNGAGKTTLIKCLLDFCSFDAGSIEIFGLPNSQPGSRQQLTFLPERFVTPYYLTGRQFIKTMQGVAARDYVEAQVIDTLRDLDLSPDALDKPVRALSKGMTQKLGLAACMLSGRRFLVLDEPMSGLDPRARARVKAKLRRLKGEGATLLMTSHSLADIEEICDHMLVLHEGSIAFAGTPVEFRSQFGEPTLEQAFLSCIEGKNA